MRFQKTKTAAPVTQKPVRWQRGSVLATATAVDSSIVSVRGEQAPAAAQAQERAKLRSP